MAGLAGVPCLTDHTQEKTALFLRRFSKSMMTD